MDWEEVEDLVRQLSAGFDALQSEYRKLHGQHQSLERKLGVARELYNEIAKLSGDAQAATPPLSLVSSYSESKQPESSRNTVPDILKNSTDASSAEAAGVVRLAVAAKEKLQRKSPETLGAASHDVKIWAGPSADKYEGSTCLMPSISESPLEQDFTIEGKPSKLGCPFASMAKKKLSSHAASVLSRYNHSNSAGAHGSVGAASTPLSTASRINGRESFSQRQSRRASIVDPIKVEICGMYDHGSLLPSKAQETRESPSKSSAPERTDNTDTGVCPIRFLDQHSPEEVATYFEKHKHELPRSHEICVMRYQSNEEQIRELDQKYGNLVSMIQGLGQKHKDMLPEEPDEAAEDDAEVLDDAKVRKWASSVSAHPPELEADDELDERQSHFERPLRDIRVGESPSRPWGIQVPVKYLEEAQSNTSSKPARANLAEEMENPPPAVDKTTKRPPGKCPFGHGADSTLQNHKPVIVEPASMKVHEERATLHDPVAKAGAAAVDADIGGSKPPQMVFTGPVFIGYSPEDAAKILSGLKLG